MSHTRLTQYKDTTTPAGEPLAPNMTAPAVTAWQSPTPTTNTGRQIARDLTKRITQLYAQLVLTKATAQQLATDGKAGKLSLFDFNHDINTLIDQISEAQNAIAPMRDMPNQIYTASKASQPPPAEPV